MAEMAIPPRTGKYPQHPCVAAEIEDLPHVLNEIQEKIETLRQIAKQES